MEEKEKQASVPYFIHEGQMARMERIIRILAALLVVAIFLFIVNNIVWMKHTDKQVAEARTEVMMNAGVYQQPDQGTDQ